MIYIYNSTKNIGVEEISVTMVKEIKARMV